MSSASLPDPDPRPAFSHASEAELARIFDFYDVRWQYEPHTFPISWSLDGEVLESFAPDFLLPDLDLYVELTTLKQRLVRKKNRKLRRLRELYPDVRIKLFYARDFRQLLLKFGRLALAEELSGTTGQATPPRFPPPGVMEAEGPAQLEAPAAGQATPADATPGALQARAGTGVRAAGHHAAAGSSPRGRRRGRRRRAAARAETDAAGSGVPTLAVSPVAVSPVAQGAAPVPAPYPS